MAESTLALPEVFDVNFAGDPPLFHSWYMVAAAETSLTAARSRVAIRGFSTQDGHWQLFRTAIWAPFAMLLVTLRTAAADESFSGSENLSCLI